MQHIQPGRFHEYAVEVDPHPHIVWRGRRAPPTRGQGVGMLVNSAEGTTWRANAKFVSFYDKADIRGTAQVYVEATKTIAVGEEVLVVYGRGFWSSSVAK